MSTDNLIKVLLMIAALIAAVLLAGCQPAQQTEAATEIPVLPTATPTAAPATPTPEPDYPTYSDLPYVDDGDRKQTLDLYLPPGGTEPLPVLFVVHGLDVYGSAEWIFGVRSKDAYDELAGHFAERGYAVVVVNYRYPSEPFQQQMTQDVACALAWMHVHADTYGIDPQRIAVFGDNLAAGPAAMLGIVDDPTLFLENCPHPRPESGSVKGVVIYCGGLLTPGYLVDIGTNLTAFTQFHGTTAEMPFKQVEGALKTLHSLPRQEWHDSASLDESAKRVARLLPLYWLDGSEPPFLLIDGPGNAGWIGRLPRDQLPPADVTFLLPELQAAGVEVQSLVFPDAKWDTVLEPEASTEIYAAIETFLAERFE
jgi:acetyl esterase/lipase